MLPAGLAHRPLLFLGGVFRGLQRGRMIKAYGNASEEGHITVGGQHRGSLQKTLARNEVDVQRQAHRVTADHGAGDLPPGLAHQRVVLG